MDRIKHILESRGAISELNPSPFSDSLYERIVTPDATFQISGSSACDVVISGIPEADASIACLLDIYAKLLRLSEECFAEASSFHFSLEDIYGEAVRFERNDAVFNDLTDKISRILEA